MIELNIAIIGYGKMGREIERVAKARGINIASVIDPNTKDAPFDEISRESMKNVDVCIDFTVPEAAIDNIKKAAGFRKNIVMATTGWYDDMDKAKKIVKGSGIGLIWSGNFSLGVNIFFRIVEDAAKIIDNVEDYDVFAYEIHHSQKKDSPSGTAKMIADMLVRNIKRKESIVTDRLDRRIKDSELHLASIRGGSVPGIHVVCFDSAADTIELKHTARNREGFALGAVMAAEWVNKKKGFFNIDDLMKGILK